MQGPGENRGWLAKAKTSAVSAFTEMGKTRPQTETGRQADNP